MLRCLLLSSLVLPCVMLWCVVLPLDVLCCVVLCCVVLCCVVLSCLVWVLSYFILLWSCLVFCCLVLSSRVLCCVVLSCLVLSFFFVWVYLILSFYGLVILWSRNCLSCLICSSLSCDHLVQISSIVPGKRRSFFLFVLSFVQRPRKRSSI
jgi:hypothetical protein